MTRHLYCDIFIIGIVHRTFYVTKIKNLSGIILGSRTFGFHKKCNKLTRAAYTANSKWWQLLRIHKPVGGQNYQDYKKSAWK